MCPEKRVFEEMGDETYFSPLKLSPPRVPTSLKTDPRKRVGVW
jgi:hypothetical protein